MNTGYKFEDLTGKNYGIMKVLKQIETEKKGRFWLCQCSICGFTRPISSTRLVTGKFEKCICKKFKENTYVEYNEYYKIFFSDGEKYFICDKDDFETYCLNRKWSLDGRGYVYCYEDRKVIRFHRLILGITDKTQEIDHINGNTLDNRKKNLRICEHIKNGKNLTLKVNNTSGTPGVCFFKRTKQWTAEIKVNYQKIHLGYFDTKDEAIQARRDAEIKYFGEYSSINSRGGTYQKLSLEEILAEEKNSESYNENDFLIT